MKLSYPILIWYFLTVGYASSDYQDTQDTDTMEVNCDTVNQRSGYIHLNDNKNMFYWWFESRSKPKEDPLVLWINGGPGTSSLLGLSQGIGPCLINSNGTKVNPHSWNAFSNLLFLDQPVGTGFSFGSGSVDNSRRAATDVVKFLIQFYQEFPQFRQLSLSIFSESYGGHFVPHIALEINRVNKLKGAGIPLRSVAISSGLFDPHIQYSSMYDSSITSTLETLDQCQRSLNRTLCNNVWDDLYNVFIDPVYEVFGNVYNYRNSNYNDILSHHMDNTINFFNKPGIQRQLGVEKEFELDSDLVYDLFNESGDMLQSMLKDLSQLLNLDIPILLLSGDSDYLTNPLGISRVAQSLKWPGKIEFNRQPSLPITLPSQPKPVANQKSHSLLTFITIYRAGHYIYLDRPGPLAHLVNQWLHNSVPSFTPEDEQTNSIVDSES